VLAQIPFKIIVCIQQDPTRKRCLRFFQEFQAGGQLAVRLPRYVLEVKECNSPEDVLKELQDHFQSKTGCALLISDLLAELVGTFPDQEARPTSWAMEVLDEFENLLLGTVAVMDQARRVPDIDRVLWQNFDAQALLNMVSLVADKLTYIARPDPCAAGVRIGPVVVRPIKDKMELQTYFLLRHRVYRIMGYLEQRVESAPSGMEIDSCDTRALHVGAFLKEGISQKLIGTARVVGFDALDDRYDQWTRSLIKTDPVLNTRLDLYDPMGLPIFQSMKLNEKMTEVLTQGQNCGELSRVIVAEDYRGMGLSELLVWFTVLQAINKGMNLLMLECLPVHERIYAKFGFQRMKGVKGRVIGVDKTMIAMELSQLGVEQMCRQPSVSRYLQVMRDQGFLQSCHDEPCSRAECDTKGKCPPR